jgi:hypothetical protein
MSTRPVAKRMLVVLWLLAAAIAAVHLTAPI